jgi:hypothetical protein
MKRSLPMPLKVLIVIVWAIFVVFIFLKEPDNSLQSSVSRAFRVIAIEYADQPNYWWIISQPPDADGMEPIAYINYAPAWDRPKEPQEAAFNVSRELSTQEWERFDEWRKEYCKIRQTKAEAIQASSYTVAIRCSGYTDIHTVTLTQEEIPPDIFAILTEVKSSRAS